MENQLKTNGHAAHPSLGLLEWFEPGEYERAEEVLADLEMLGVGKLRTGFSWAEWHTEEGKEWYSWLMPRLAKEVEVLPCFTYTPPELGIEPKCASPPRNPQHYVEFVERMITRFDECFSWVEFWNEPNNTNDWDWHLDPDWEIFSGMVRSASERAQKCGKRTVLAGMCPPDLNWLDMICRRGVTDFIDAVGVHAFPGTWTFNWKSWADTIAGVREVLARHGADAELWITEAGYSTWQYDEYRQLQEFVKALHAPADRLYWYAAHDLSPERSHQEGFHEDERHYHLGLRQANGRAKLLFRIWAEAGLEGVEELATLGRRSEDMTSDSSEEVCGSGVKTLSRIRKNGQRPVLITGGAGFVGANLAHRLLSEGTPVLVYDNLSRPRVERNLHWLIDMHGEERLSWMVEDVRNPYALREAVAQASAIYHFAGQVAVTDSMARPAEDFEINMQGTMHLLEALRAEEAPPPLVFTSTNKVYGDLADIDLQEEATRYVPTDERLRSRGIDEERPLDFHSPYGCSKGAAEQYVLDYARTYGLPALVFRMSCIYGAHQFGTEDQGWVAHFARSVLEETPLTIYGDGKQVRDVLFIEDLLQALLLARQRAEDLSGEAFNIGGGPGNETSLLELIDLLAELHGAKPPLRFDDWRRGDQRYYVTDASKFAEATGWSPETGKREGVAQLYAWMREAQASQQLPVTAEEA